MPFFDVSTQRTLARSSHSGASSTSKCSQHVIQTWSLEFYSLSCSLSLVPDSIYYFISFTSFSTPQLHSLLPCFSLFYQTFFKHTESHSATQTSWAHGSLALASSVGREALPPLAAATHLKIQPKKWNTPSRSLHQYPQLQRNRSPKLLSMDGWRRKMRLINTMCKSTCINNSNNYSNNNNNALWWHG